MGPIPAELEVPSLSPIRKVSVALPDTHHQSSLVGVPHDLGIGGVCARNVERQNHCILAFFDRRGRHRRAIAPGGKGSS
jgi:hypothetical protein